MPAYATIHRWAVSSRCFRFQAAEPLGLLALTGRAVFPHPAFTKTLSSESYPREKSIRHFKDQIRRLNRRGTCRVSDARGPLWLPRTQIRAYRWCSAIMSPNRSIGVCRVRPCRPTSFRSRWQNGLVERLIGSARRECMDHVIVFNEEHRRRILSNSRSHLIHRPARDIIPRLGGISGFLLFDLILF